MAGDDFQLLIELSAVEGAGRSFHTPGGLGPEWCAWHPSATSRPGATRPRRRLSPNFRNYTGHISSSRPVGRRRGITVPASRQRRVVILLSTQALVEQS